ncbi:MAG: hypothetical protein LH468_12040 [Nocardioides sp.]|nr:hypothetical protein [Nocardioides sp.]
MPADPVDGSELDLGRGAPLTWRAGYGEMARWRDGEMAAPWQTTTPVPEGWHGAAVTLPAWSVWTGLSAL